MSLQAYRHAEAHLREVLPREYEVLWDELDRLWDALTEAERQHLNEERHA